VPLAPVEALPKAKAPRKPKAVTAKVTESAAAQPDTLAEVAEVVKPKRTSKPKAEKAVKP
jgi:cell pole-organizing protein PopZ